MSRERDNRISTPRTPYTRVHRHHHRHHRAMPPLLPSQAPFSCCCPMPSISLAVVWSRSCYSRFLVGDCRTIEALSFWLRLHSSSLGLPVYCALGFELSRCPSCKLRCVPSAAATVCRRRKIFSYRRKRWWSASCGDWRRPTNQFHFVVDSTRLPIRPDLLPRPINWTQHSRLPSGQRVRNWTRGNPLFSCSH